MSFVTVDNKLRSQCSYGKQVPMFENYFWKRSSTTNSNLKLPFKCYEWQHNCKTTSRGHQNQSILKVHSLSPNQQNIISDRMAVHTAQDINFTFVTKIEKYQN